ncbi:MAG: PilZ domain protein [Candidatus Accumulibacter appositus]|uniref:Cyclic diguanosine monophosphate-binding protein n=1 Tax=Candidatus Accumulibacter appositus TaxID=1454003 RepID=A0A011PNK3_9PROT|nr:PilZ domain-containing protein [Accumulibacter sp.]EXI78592.1 MAG: PilZ domain protein [Candidatus Accumulibacter appositus]HRF03547.1 PilZ domain-containing protein [Accumulibacter sp.]
MTEQRRHYSRISFTSAAQLLLAEQPCEVLVVDLSLRGALIQLPTQAEPGLGATAELRVHLDAAGTELRMQTTVAHREGRRAGLACQSIDVDSVTHLRRLVELNAGDPDLLQRELSALLCP